MGASRRPAMRVNTKRMNIIPENRVCGQSDCRAGHCEEVVVAVVAVEGEVGDMRKMIS